MHEKAAKAQSNLIGKPSSISKKEAHDASAKANAATKSLTPVDGPVAVSSSRNAVSESTKGDHANAAASHTSAAKEHHAMAQSHREYDAKQKK